MNRLKTSILPRYSNRLDYLEQNLVREALIFEKKNPTSLVPDHLTDLIKSYVVLVYAETEEFVETLSLAHLDHLIENLEWLQSEFSKKSKIGKTEKKIAIELLGPLVDADTKKKKLLTNILSNTAKPNCDISKKLLTSLLTSARSWRKDVFFNNSLNSQDLEKMFDRAGFDTANRFMDLRNDLNILTTKRGRFAHTGAKNEESEIQANMPNAAAAYLPLAKEETKKVAQIARHLAAFVNELTSRPSIRQ